jgi:hypothetical protein
MAVLGVRELAPAFPTAEACFYLVLYGVIVNTIIIVVGSAGRKAAAGLPHSKWTIRCGQVYGKWPGLADHQLNEGRDLALTTDFRFAVGEILTKHIGVADLEPVFPGFDNNPRKFPGLILS